MDNKLLNPPPQSNVWQIYAAGIPVNTLANACYPTKAPFVCVLSDSAGIYVKCDLICRWAKTGISFKLHLSGKLISIFRI